MFFKMYPDAGDSIKWKYFLDIPDMITCIVVGIILAIVNFTMPVEPLFTPPNDSGSSFPYPGKSTIPTIWCGVIVFGFGIVEIIVFFFLARKCQSAFRQFNPFAALWGLILVVLVTLLVTTIFKNFVGRGRPDLYAACGPEGTIDACKAKLGSRDGEDEFKSWPSGHSSTAMSGLAYVTFLGQKVVKTKMMFVSVLWSMCIVLAVYVGATRIRDYRHRPDDVIAGLFIGFVFAWVLWTRFSKRVFGKEDSTDEALGP